MILSFKKYTHCSDYQHVVGVKFVLQHHIFCSLITRCCLCVRCAVTCTTVVLLLLPSLARRDPLPPVLAVKSFREIKTNNQAHEQRADFDRFSASVPSTQNVRQDA
jgi:hypothetical protein